MLDTSKGYSTIYGNLNKYVLIYYITLRIAKLKLIKLAHL